MKININDTVRVILTEEGSALYNADIQSKAEQLSQYGADVAALYRESNPQKQAGDVWQGSMWEIMKVLAPSFGNGFPNVIERCIVETVE